jgi:hypothetical protein
MPTQGAEPAKYSPGIVLGKKIRIERKKMSIPDININNIRF